MPRQAVSDTPAGERRGFTDRLVLWAHGQAVRFDWLPSGFGDAEPVDEADPAALRREWRRQVQVWADSSPEQLFALKAGALMLGGALAAMVLLIGLID